MVRAAYTLRRAETADLAAVMRVERQSFEEGIAEDESVFAERLICAPECSYVLVRTADSTVCGYFTAEIWGSSGVGPDSFALGHSIRERHQPCGTALYISSFALLPAVRGKRVSVSQASAAVSASVNAFTCSDSCKRPKERRTIGIAEMFFAAALERIRVSVPQLERVILLVHEDWHKALRIYERQGFTRTRVLDRFAWFGGKRAFIYEKTMGNGEP